MKRVVVSVVMLFVPAFFLLAQQPAPAESNVKPGDFSGMYTFLKEGEFVQITLEDQGRVSGFISRYGDLDSDRGAFLDQFFKSGSTDGSKLEFTTNAVHGTFFQFQGRVQRGPGKNPGDEAYYVLTGKLTRFTTDENKKTSAESREVTFKSFPQDVEPETPDHQ